MPGLFVDFCWLVCFCVCVFFFGFFLGGGGRGAEGRYYIYFFKAVKPAAAKYLTLRLHVCFSCLFL